MSIAFVDVQYDDPRARAACVVATTWTDARAIEERVVTVTDVKPYVPGAFFERELPCIAAVMAAVTTPLTTLVVDGYVELDASGTPGLGAHVYDHFAGKLAVVGVAKTAFRGSAFATPIVRGASKSPLFVTARGISSPRRRASSPPCMAPIGSRPSSAASTPLHAVALDAGGRDEVPDGTVFQLSSVGRAGGC